MNLGMYLAGGRGFWLAVATGALLTAILLFGWALPAHRTGVQARQGLDQVYMELRHFQSVAKDIPSPRTLQDRKGFRVYLDEQAKIVDEFFAERAALITASLTGTPDPAPASFKEAYSQALKRQEDWFAESRRQIKVPAPGTAFTVHPWVRSSALPKPETYAGVLRDYWSRHHLYHRFDDAEVSAVASLSFGKDMVRLTDKYGGIHFRAALDIAPDRVAGLLDEMLKVSSTAGDPRAVFLIESFEVAGESEMAGPRPLCRVSISGHVLALR